MFDKKEYMREYNKQYSEANKERLKEKRKKYYQENKEKRREYIKKWREENKDKHRERNNNYHNTRYKSDHLFRLSKNIRNIMSRAIKTKRTEVILGCSFKQLKKHLEAQFTEGMTWENYGYYGWHIDHIIPLNHFDITDPDEVAKANHYTNLQPLWWEENLSKGNRYIA